VRIGIIGAGRLGQAMARTALQARRSVVIANSRRPESLTALAATLGEGAAAGTADQAAEADIVVIAVPWSSVPDAVQGLEWNGRIVIDATNDFDGSDLNGRTSSELVAGLVADAGFAAIDLGGLSTCGALQQVGGPLSGNNLIQLPDQ
jgi:8-hydroxy-5-deazaflavin:NADPH oxidoreductase